MTKILIKLHAPELVADFEYGVIEMTQATAAWIVDMHARLRVSLGEDANEFPHDFHRCQFFAGDAVTVHYDSDEIKEFIASQFAGGKGCVDETDRSSLVDGFLVMPDEQVFPCRNYDGEHLPPRIDCCTINIGKVHVLWRFYPKHGSDDERISTAEVPINFIQRIAARQEVSNDGR